LFRKERQPENNRPEKQYKDEFITILSADKTEIT